MKASNMSYISLSTELRLQILQYFLSAYKSTFPQYPRLADLDELPASLWLPNSTPILSKEPSTGNLENDKQFTSECRLIIAMPNAFGGPQQ